MPWGHDQLQRDLAEHLSKPERLLWEDMQLGPVGSPRPDVYTMRKSYSNPAPLAYEVKISVSDYRSDVTTGKWQKYLHYACGVIFAVPKGLITKADLPAGCGLIVRHENVWRTAKAPTLSPVELPQDAMLKLLIDGIERYTPERRKKFHSGWLQEKAKKGEFSEEVALVLRDIEMAKFRAKDLDGERKRILDRARDQADAIIKRAREKGESIEANALKAAPIFFEALGMEPTDNYWGVRNQIDDMKKSLHKDSQVEAMHNFLNRMEQNLAEARKILKPLEETE